MIEIIHTFDNGQTETVWMPNSTQAAILLADPVHFRLASEAPTPPADTIVVDGIEYDRQPTPETLVKES